MSVVWVTPVFVGWEAGDPALRAVAAMAPSLAMPVLFHLALTAQRAPSPGLRATVTAGYLVLGGLGLVAGAVHNPFLDLDSWSNISDFAFLAADPVLARELRRWLLVLTVVAGAAAGIVVLARAVRPVRWRGMSVWGPALVALAGEAGYAAFLLRTPLEQFTSPTGTALFEVRSASLVALGVAVAWRADARRRLLRRMRGLVAELAQRPPAGMFEELMREALRDDHVEVLYWMRERREYVDSAGRPRSEPEPDGRARARVVRGDEPVALVSYHPERTGDAFLEQQLGAAARLAIDNERLRAESLAHLRELTESRARVVAAGDQQRRIVERDLHDGAQQRLLAVLFELRLARADAVAAGDDGLVARLETAVESAGSALAELREFAHGVFPAVLDESGLEQALWSLADRGRVTVDLEVHLGQGAATPVAERTAYLVAKAALDGAVEHLTLDVSRADGKIVLVASGVGEVDEVHLSDRVGAVGGELRNGGGRLEAVIPCE
jgi:signal transduction histidine kinase